MADGLARRGELLDIYGQHAFYSAGYPLLLAPFFVLLGSSLVAILVLALFAHDRETASHYAVPELLWLLCLPLLYWLNRIWMMARRGEVEGDPVAFAIKDRRSILVGAAMVCIFGAALYGPVMP